MKKTGAWLARYALEQLGIRHTFGIPGVHNTELYDELGASPLIEPILVTHECHGAFMADAISRSSDSIGTLVIVPAAGVTHAMSGIGEAYLDGIPMLVICGGVRSDSDYDYQLHQLDQQQLVAGVTKASYRILSHQEVIPTLYQAYQVATQGEPGPVFVELPVNIQLDKGEVEGLPEYQPPAAATPDLAALAEAVNLLKQANRPGIFVGWGGVDCHDSLVAIAEHLGAPVATTLQGLSSFPADHPLHVGMGFGPAAVPAARHAFEGCDCLLAIGTRFAEIGTGSFGVTVPDKLIHLDINPGVFNKNYPAAVTLCGDARSWLPALAEEIRQSLVARDYSKLAAAIQADKANYRQEWRDHDSGGRVNPQYFFDGLRELLADEDIVVADDGNHTFLTAELMPIRRARRFISPTDFNCMGYAAPAAIAAKLANPEARVAAVIGDGAFLMTAMELSTAVARQLGVLFCIFNDGELSQISQAQQIPYNRKTCTVLPSVKLQGIAMATGAEYLCIESSSQVPDILARAERLTADGRPVVLDVLIDYTKATSFTQGIVNTNLKRMPMGTKVRMVSRALYRRVTG